MIFVEIFWVNLIHTLKIGIYLWYLSSGPLHFHFWPDCAQQPEFKIGVIGKSFMATWVLRNLEKAAGLTWNRVRGWGQNELSTRCCTEIDFTSKKEFGFVKSSKCANSRSIQDQLKIRDLSGLGTWFLIVVFTLTYFDAAGTCTLGRFQNSIFVTPPVRKHKSVDIWRCWRWCSRATRAIFGAAAAIPTPTQVS